MSLSKSVIPLLFSTAPPSAAPFVREALRLNESWCLSIPTISSHSRIEAPRNPALAWKLALEDGRLRVQERGFCSSFPLKLENVRGPICWAPLLKA